MREEVGGVSVGGGLKGWVTACSCVMDLIGCIIKVESFFRADKW